MRREGSQLTLVVPEISHPSARELGEIRRILDSKFEVERRAGQDLVREVARPETGGRGMTGSQVLPILERQRRLYGGVPRQACFDGAFASLETLRRAKELGVEDVAFSRKRGLKVNQMVKDSWLYQRLRNFRAGIEPVISFLKRVFGLGRCTWRGLGSFKAHVQASVLSANLLVFARHRMA